MAIAQGFAGVDWGHWFGIDLAWRLGGGLAIGWIVGYALMHVVFRVEREDGLSRTGDGLTALAIVLIVYGPGRWSIDAWMAHKAGR